jgi:uncharacterized protein GlcG (DUF336 family)
MIRRTLLAAAVLFTGGVALAQPSAAPPAAQQPRARAPELALAVELAMEAVSNCKASGFRTAVLVTDAAGTPVVLLSGDGAGPRLQQIAPTKAAMVIKYKVASGVTTAKAAADPALAAEIRADPAIGMPRAGALPIMVGAETIGVVAVAGAPTGAADEVCGAAGIAKVQSRLK